jgi:hypothetical protein
MTLRPSRREFLGATALALATPRLQGRNDGTISFRLTETAGLRRFGYPVSTLLPVGVPDHPYRLVRDGRLVPAQFTATRGPAGGPRIALDFAASPGPLEAQVYEVRVRDDEPPPPDLRNLVTIERPGGGDLIVRSGPDLRWGLREDLGGFLRTVAGGRLAYLRPDSTGLIVKGSGGDWAPFDAQGVQVRGERSGPFAARVVYEGRRGDAPWRLDATFPRTKSWVEARWEISDLGGDVAGLGFELDLAIDGEPTLVDFGTRDTVYGTLKGDESMALVAGHCPGLPASERGWLLTKGSQEFARDPGLGGAQGWAHVMDKDRCTALAVADFAAFESRDRIEVRAPGRVRVTREFAADQAKVAPGPKRLGWWLHFVSMPVHVGAVTSPQSMQAPLRVEWD